MLSAKCRLLLIMLGLVGIAIILASTRHYGAGVSPDSVGYIASARHIAEGKGVVSYDGSPLIVQPPLYPAFLAVIDNILGVDPLSSAHVVNAILFGLIVYLSGVLFIGHLRKSTVLALLGVVSILTAKPLIMVSQMAWSEPLFICFTLFYFIFSKKYSTQKDETSLLFLSLSVGLACLTRYIGIILIFVGAVGILLLRKENSRVKLKHLLLFILVSSLPIGVLVIRNYLLSATLFGPRGHSAFTLSQNLTFTFNTMLDWYFPKGISEHRSALMLIGVVLGFLGGLYIKGNWAKARAALAEVFPPLLFIIVYVGFLVGSSTIVAYDRIDDRLLSPIFVPAMLSLLFFASEVLMSLTVRRFSWRNASLLLAAAVAVWLVLHPTAVSASLIDYAMNRGLGYSSKSWRSSSTIECLLQMCRTSQSTCTIYSNAPDAIYILANLMAKFSPMKGVPNIGSWPNEDHAYLVWFDEKKREYLLPVDELQKIADIQQIIRLEDGAVYSVTRR